jgi:hypothetical protein
MLRAMERLMLIAILLMSAVAVSQAVAPAKGENSTVKNSGTPAWLPFPIPAPLYEKWRKYGEWDYKEQSFEYRDFTLFNFGATGSAAGMDENSLQALANASKPTPDDVARLNSSELESNFQRHPNVFEALRAMAEQDSGVIRIASDFTWLENNTKWPREDVGFSETRWNDYRKLFTKLSLHEGIVRTKDFQRAIFFIAQTRGLCTGGSSDGYVYSSIPLSPLVKSPADALNAGTRQNPGKHYSYVFKTLAANWYTFYEVDW